MEEAILVKDINNLVSQDRLKNDIKELINKEKLRVVKVSKYV